MVREWPSSPSTGIGLDKARIVRSHRIQNPTPRGWYPEIAYFAAVAQLVERVHGKDKVTSSILVGGSIQSRVSVMVKSILTRLPMNEPTLQELVDKYLQYCEIIKSYSIHTTNSYRLTFKLLFKDTKLVYPRDLSRQTLEEFFFNGRLTRKWSAVTFRDHFKHLNPVMKWMIKEGFIAENPLKDIEKPRVEHKIPKTLSKDQASLVLDAAFHMRYQYKFERFRNRAIIGIMLLAGLRRQEVMKLKLNDVSLESRSIFINQGKWSKDRVIPINSKLYTILQEYLKERNRADKECVHFFVGAQKDVPIGTNCIKKLIEKTRKRTKINFSPHTLRHAFARLMLEGGCDIYTLSKIMGHSKITTTTIYLSCSNQQMGKSIEMHSLN